MNGFEVHLLQPSTHSDSGDLGIMPISEIGQTTPLRQWSPSSCLIWRQDSGYDSGIVG